MAIDPASRRLRVAAARVGRLATVTPEGRPHVVPCTFGLDGDVVYTAVDAKPKSTLALRRLDNIRANPHVSLLVDHYDDDWTALWWVRVDGLARVIGDGPGRDRGLAVLVEKYPQYRDRPPPGAVIEIRTSRWTSWP